jgi:hypothetical protein
LAQNRRKTNIGVKRVLNFINKLNYLNNNDLGDKLIIGTGFVFIELNSRIFKFNTESHEKVNNHIHHRSANSRLEHDRSAGIPGRIPGFTGR